MSKAVDLNAIVGTHDILWVVLDSLRYDVARTSLAAGETPHLGAIVGEWEERHTPSTFTWPAHHAFFSGFLPTPARRPRAPRLFAPRFAGSETIDSTTFVFDDAYVVPALAARGYRTICIGGVGFFNPNVPIGRVFAALFGESHWSPEMGPESKTCAERQFALAAKRVRASRNEQPLFLFLNVAAIHRPNAHYRGTPGPDDLVSHKAALRAVDAQFPMLVEAFAERNRPLFFVICSDHGTAYGEDGYRGHRLAHDVVWTVPYADGVLPQRRK